MERFLYRLSKSPRGERFVLKGALMLAMWVVSLTRPTKNIDLLGHVANDIDRIVGVLKRVCGQEVEPDGLPFDKDGAQARSQTQPPKRTSGAQASITGPPFRLTLSRFRWMFAAA